MNILHMTIELIIGSIVLFLVTKVIGKTQINELTPFHFSLSDGQVLWDNLESTDLNIVWLKEQLETEGYQDIEDIYYAEWLEGTGLFLQGYN